MGDCRFCGKPAGFLRHEHKECRRAHDDAAEKITGFFAKALHDPVAVDRFHKLIDQDAAQNFIGEAERGRLIRQGFGAAIRAALSEGALAPADDKRLDELQDAFGLTLADLGNNGMALAKARILRAINAGEKSPIKLKGDGPLAPRLGNGELALWMFNNVNYFMMRSRTRYVGGSSGVSIRVMRGVYYRTGSFHGEPIKTDYMSNEDTGSLTIAEHNIYFVGTHRALKIPLKKIASAQLYSDGIEILQNGVTAKPAIFKLDDPPFAANLLSQLQG